MICLRLALACILILLPLHAQAADGWDLEIRENPHGPSSFVVVDKSRQELYLFEQHSPLDISSALSCSTGQSLGDKYAEGDLRTPEGVYFLERRLDSGLDYDLYGSLAYTLNFPNPVDILKGKTGSGIWIHGRGHNITPLETKGCVALNDNDMSSLDNKLDLGQPAIIADKVRWAPGVEQPADETTDLLAGMVQAWARSWESKSDEFFGFYHPQNFARTTGASFDSFTSHKRNLFQSLPWIEVMVEDIRVIPGPDYWVTYFGQFYRSPYLVSEGVKRLYWQRDDKGRLRIVGREWDRRPLGLRNIYLDAVRQEVSTLVELWRQAWEQADLEAYVDFYDQDAEQESRDSRSDIVQQKRELWTASPPKSVALNDLQVELHQIGLKVEFTQEYASQTGYQDKGRKTLLLRPYNNSWRIVSEEWSAM